ncbi:MAG TPA: hypothetical protein VG267_08510 [Terracidiphilus sp.]|jgi:hypothetical protein|nr:hypothetical protein [Terracidiphilus sp.]
MRRSLPLLLLGLFCLSAPLLADGPAFDLAGPKVDVHVKRGALTLPISQVPNILPGDRLWIHPDLPESQSAHFVLVVAFLRGATNPPPWDWFTRVETWTRSAREEGVFVTVPQEAQQALIFLAPETGGDFSTLRKAVHDRPGAFVRATQDLEAASWDRMRLEAYLTQVRNTSQVDPKILKESAELAARSLGVRLEAQCFDKPTDQQASCLTQHTEGLVLDDANTQSLVAQLANGSAADLMNQLSYSTMGGAGMYSPYVGAIVDTAKILSSLHTAHFQYIPALALPTKDTLNLRLNVPPSFRDPKSVVVVALPPVGPSRLPPLHPINPSESSCAQKPDLVFAAEGAPLVFAAGLAHDLALHIDTSRGPLALPLLADPAKGGLVLKNPLPDLPAGALTATVHGKWGFDDWEGPHFHLVSAGPEKWEVAADDQSALIVGREDTLHIQGDSTLCVDAVDMSGNTLTWKAPKPESLVVSVPMKSAQPGPITFQIHQYGLGSPDALTLNAYAEAASLDHLSLSVGDRSATLKGTRLDEVAKAMFDGIAWTPAGLTRVQDFDQLALNTTSSTSKLEANAQFTARVQLRDGRELKVPVIINPPRPQVSLLNKGVQDDGVAAPSPVHLGSPDDFPLSSRLVFFLKSVVPQAFPRNEDVEVAAGDGSFHTMLSLADGSLMLEDQRTALGSVEPLARFGSSAFGPLRARAISADGVAGDWMPLGTLVRLPSFKDLRCPRSTARPCILTGTNLFLVNSIAAAQDFGNATDVPPDFTGAQITVPHPVGGMLYLKLRDDPNTVQTLNMPVTLVTLSLAQTASTPIAPIQPPVAPPAASAPDPADSTAPARPETNPKPEATTPPPDSSSPQTAPGPSARPHP